MMPPHGGIPGGPLGGPGVAQANYAALMGGGPGAQKGGCNDCEGGGCDSCGDGCGSCGGSGCGDCADGCGACGGGGCRKCRWGIFGPQGTGACCRPRWFDAHVEYMYLRRDDVSRFGAFSSDTIRGNADPNVVLSTDDLDFGDYESGFRVTLAYLTGANSNLELSYFGTFNVAAAAEINNPNNSLFSVMSDFGNTPFGGFQESDQATRHRIEYSSEFHNLELNNRLRHVSRNCRWHWSWLYGVRYFRLDEDFTFISEVNQHQDLTDNTVTRPDSDLNYLVNAENDLVGFQMGGDMWLCLAPGLRVGGDFKAGVYGNHARASSRITATTINGAFEEEIDDTDVALVAEANVMAVWRINDRLAIRGGAHILFVAGVALGPENFNTPAPNVFGGADPDARVPFINTNGNVTYYGLTGGIEWTW